MHLSITKAAIAFENQARLNGTAFPKIESLVIDSGNSPDGETVAQEVCAFPVLSKYEVSTGVIEFRGAPPVDQEMQINGLALRCDDGMIYAYCYVEPNKGGIWKGKGYNLEMVATVSHQASTNLQMQYIPIDANAIADQIKVSAQVAIDAHIQDYFVSVLQGQAQIQQSITELIIDITNLKHRGG